ncbi:MAG: DNA polymerase III subunit delta [Pseudomonadota bacterium]
MSLKGRQQPEFCTTPDPEAIGALIAGADAGRVASLRETLTNAVLGGSADPLSITSLAVADARKDPASIDEAVRARGFFAGRQVVVIDGGTDGLSKPLMAVLQDVTVEDAFLIVTAGQLPARSTLRKAFEGHPGLAYIPVYEQAMDPSDIESSLKAMGLDNGVTPDAIHLLMSAQTGMDYGSFQQLLRTIALFGLRKSTPLEAADIRNVIPAQAEADIDTFVEAVADGAATEIGPRLQKLKAGSASPVSILIGMSRHFRLLLRINTSAGGPEAGLSGIRPPLWGPRRDRISSQARRWSQDRLEQANQLLFETDARLRSVANAPEFAVLERTALRLALMGRGR